MDCLVNLDPQNMRTLSTVAQTVKLAPHSATATTLSPMPPALTRPGIAPEAPDLV